MLQHNDIIISDLDKNLQGPTDAKMRRLGSAPVRYFRLFNSCIVGVHRQTESFCIMVKLQALSTHMIYALTSIG